MKTYIGQQPTLDRNSYLILFFNFALVNPAIDEVEASFETTGTNEVNSFLRRYQSFFVRTGDKTFKRGKILPTNCNGFFIMPPSST